MSQTFELLLVEQCAPTLAGVKPASLFRYGAAGLPRPRAAAAKWNRLLEPMGLSVCVLKECEATGAGMIYVYRRPWVERLLAAADNRAFLRRRGYRPGALCEMLDQLSQRLCLERDYPHEIGVFLGYPLQDVVGFIENQGWNYTCCGYWKAYGDPSVAQARFASYRRCTAVYRRLYARGKPVTELVVAAS